MANFSGGTIAGNITPDTSGRVIGASTTTWNIYVGTLYLSATQTITPGTGTPEGVVTASVGSMFLRSDGGTSTTLYVKESGSGNTGWVAK